MFKPSKGTVDVKRNQQHGDEFKFYPIARCQEDGVIVLGKIFTALVGDLRVYQQFVIQAEVNCCSGEKADIPSVMNGLGMF